MAATTAPPLIIDLGRKSRKRIRELKNREGLLMQDVSSAVSELRAASPELADKELVPVVFVYEKKKRGVTAGMGMMPRGIMPCCGKMIPGCSCR